MLWAIKYMALDLWAQRALERQLVKQGDVITDVDVATEVELVATEIYRDLLSKMDVGRFCTGAIFDNTPGGNSGHGTDNSPAPEVASLQPARPGVVPLVAASPPACLGSDVPPGQCPPARRSLADLPGQTAAGHMLIKQAGQMMHANNAGRRVLARQDGLLCGPDGQLDAAAVNEAQPRLACCAELCRGGGCDTLCRRLPGAPHVQRGGLLGAVVLVSDPAALVLPEASRQTDLYGLTPAQARVARELATGKSSKDVARALNVSPETVRTQTRDVYQKMRILSQADLVRCILTLWHASV